MEELTFLTVRPASREDCASGRQTLAELTRVKGGQVGRLLRSEPPHASRPPPAPPLKNNFPPRNSHLGHTLI